MNFLGVTVVFWFQHAPVRGPKTPTNLDSFKRKSTYLSTKTKSPPSGVFSLIWSGSYAGQLHLHDGLSIRHHHSLSQNKCPKIHSCTSSHPTTTGLPIHFFSVTNLLWAIHHAPEERLHVPEACEGVSAANGYESKLLTPNQFCQNASQMPKFPESKANHFNGISPHLTLKSPKSIPPFCGRNMLDS